MHLLFFTYMLLNCGMSYANYRSGKATTLRLNDHNEIPVLGLGTSVGRNGNSSEIQKAVEEAIDAGYRHIDTAAIYKTEKQVGLGVKSKIREGTIRRSDIFITTKLAGNRHEENQVVPALRQSLVELGLDYVDLYLIHWPVSTYDNESISDVDYLETWRGMEEVRGLGLARSIGVSNFNEEQLERLWASAKIKPAVNQIEVNPNLTQKKLVEYCHKKGIQVVAYSPLGSMPERIFKNERPAPRLDDPILMEIGAKYNKNTVQVVLRYLVDRDLIPIPKSVTSNRIRANIDIFDFSLTPEEVSKIDQFNMDYRIIEPTVWKDSPYYPF